MTHHCCDEHCHDHHDHHGHHDHHDAPEHASVFAAQRSFAPERPVLRTALEAAARALFLSVGESCCIDGILPGHAKGLIETEGAALSLSLTCAGRVDTASLGGWAALETLSAFTVTVNVHLLTPHTLDEERLLAPFQAL